MRGGLKYLIPAILLTVMGSRITGQELEPASKEDLNVKFSLGNYSVGDELNYSGEVENPTSSKISIKSREGKGLEWELWKWEEDGENRKLCATQTFKENINFIFKEGGVMKFSYEKNKLNIETEDVTTKYRGIPIPDFILNLVLSNIDIPVYIFKEKGKYSILFRSPYSKDREDYLMIVESDKFEVLDK